METVATTNNSTGKPDNQYSSSNNYHKLRNDRNDNVDDELTPTELSSKSSQQSTHIHPSSSALDTTNKSVSTTSPTLTTPVAAATTTRDNINGTSNNPVVYDVEHLATFSTNSSHETNNKSATTINLSAGGSANNNNNNNGSNGDGRFKTSNDNDVNHEDHNSAKTTPKVALQRLFELEKLSGIWTQRMQIELREDFMLIVDCETNSIVERFDRDCVTKPEAFNHYNDIYNNIVVFIIQQQASKNSSQRRRRNSNEDYSDDDELSGASRVPNFNESDSFENGDDKEGELHIFHCVSHKAQQLVKDILNWKLQQPKGCTDKKLAQNMGDSSQIIRGSKSPVNENTATTMTQNISKTNNNSKVNGRHEISSKLSNGADSKLEASKKLPKATNNTNGASGKPVVKVSSGASNSENVPVVNVNVKETVQVFNQIAALREKSSKSTSPTNHINRPLSDASLAGAHSPATTAANGPVSSGSSNGLGDESNSVRLPLSPGGQLYKQRSIRATLAPKYTSMATSSGGSESPGPIDQLEASQAATAAAAKQHAAGSSSGSSSAGSAAEPHAKTAAYHSQAAGSKHHHGHATEHHSAKKAAGVTSNGSSARSSQGPQAMSHPSSGYQAQHKSSSKSSSKHQQRTHSDSSRSHSSSQSHLDQVTTNESYVSVLNHCFDDIEKFIIRLQQAIAAIHELQTKRKLSKRAAGGQAANKESPLVNGQQQNGKSTGSNGSPLNAADLAVLSARARGPSEDDYFEILSKFKLAFNLLAKLKGCIHEPNAPELVHFLFTPLAIIIESARNATPPIDPKLVGIPYLNQDALDLLSNCCTSKESDMWISLGPNWTQTIDVNLLKASRLPSSFQPIFSDGWAPIIGELELIGLIGPSSLNQQPEPEHQKPGGHRLSQEGRRGAHPVPYLLDDVQLGASGGGNYSMDARHQHPANYSTGGKVGQPSKASSKEFRRNRDGSLNHRLMQDQTNAIDLVQQQQLPYLNQQQMNSSAPYAGYFGPHDDPMLTSERDLHHQSQLRLDHSRNLKFGSVQGQGPRRSKQSSRLNPADYPLGPTPYDATGHYPPMSLQPLMVDGDTHHLDADLLAHQNGPLNCSDDYSELQDHYLNEQPRTKIAPGPSHYRQPENGHKRQGTASGSRHKSGGGSGQFVGHQSYNRTAPIMHDPYGTSANYLSEIDHEAMLVDLGPAQTEWFYELQAQGAVIVRVLFTRDANNDKELSVRRGEILEVLDDTRKWWRCRNIDLQVAHVPHTIVAIMQNYQTLDELLASNPGNLTLDESNMMNQQQQQRFSRREVPVNPNYNHQHQWQARDEKRNSNAAGAFRYF